jgi:hypothetical protein
MGEKQRTTSVFPLQRAKEFAFSGWDLPNAIVSAILSFNRRDRFGNFMTL